MRLGIFIGIILFCVAARLSAAQPFTKISAVYQQRIKPLLKQYCLSCHSTEKEKGELDLERFAKLEDVRRSPKVWVKVVEMIEDGEMPPKKEAQFTAAERKAFLRWVKEYLDAEALASAGDPGRVVVRRLQVPPPRRPRGLVAVLRYTAHGNVLTQILAPFGQGNVQRRRHHHVLEKKLVEITHPIEQ